MSVGDISLDSVLPAEYEMPTHVSTSKNILRKQRIRFLPNAQITYDPDGNSVIEFEVSDPSSFLLLPESYFVFDIYRNDNTGAYNYNAHFDKGGIHSVVRNFEVYNRSTNTRIHQMQSYNRFFALTRSYHLQKSAMQFFYSMQGESKDCYDAPLRRNCFKTTLLAQGACASTGIGSFITSASGLTQFLTVGDTCLVRASSTDGLTQYAPFLMSIQTISNNTANDQCEIGFITAGVNTVIGSAAGTSLASGNELAIYKLMDDPIRNNAYSNVYQSEEPYFPTHLPERYRLISITGEANKQRVLWEPFSSFFTKNIPLFTLKMGLRFRIELERGGRCINTGLGPLASTTEPKYVIANPRFVGMLSAPDGSVIKNVVAQWNSPMGLLYYCPTYKYRESTESTDTTNTALNFHYGVRSAKGIAVTIQDNTVANGNNGIQFSNYSLSTNLRDGVKNYQVQFGAHQYPVERVDMTFNNDSTKRDFAVFENQRDLYNWSFLKNPNADNESYRETKRIYCNNQANAATGAATGRDLRWRNNVATENNLTLKAVADDFIMYRDLSRSITEDNILCGTDVSMAPLQVNIERDVSHSSYGFTGNVVYRAYLFHDAFIRIGSQITTSIE